MTMVTGKTRRAGPSSGCEGAGKQPSGFPRGADQCLPRLKMEIKIFFSRKLFVTPKTVARET